MGSQRTNSGALYRRVTYGLVNGRPEVIGVEVWSVDPATLPKRATGMTKKEVEHHWHSPVWMPTGEPDGAIRSKDLRLPLGRMVSEYVARVRRTATMLTSEEFLANPRPDPGFKHPRIQARQRVLLELLDEGAPKKAGRPALPVSHYVEVAEVYTEALRNGANPRAAVKEHFHVSKSSAAKWVHRCRLAPLNLLAKTSSGRAAGAFDPDNATPKPKGTK